jgi:small subunit ribosomal protein S18
MVPKNRQRLANLRRANRKMPRRRLDIPAEKISFRHPEFLAKFVTETGKIYSRRVTGLSAWLHRKITREIKRARSLNLMR